jgi:hypothetical protein
MNHLRFTRRLTRSKQPRWVRVALFSADVAVTIRVRNGRAEVMS